MEQNKTKKPYEPAQLTKWSLNGVDVLGESMDNLGYDEDWGSVLPTA